MMTLENGNSSKGVAEIILSKNRNGPVDDVFLRFREEKAQFTDMEDIDFDSLGGLEDNSFTAFKKRFYSPSYQIVQTHDIVEDTDTVFQMNVTECLVAKIYIDAGAGDIGYAHHCYGDYSGAKGFNSKIKLVRDKTLIQGHDCCNFRYVITG